MTDNRKAVSEGSLWNKYLRH